MLTLYPAPYESKGLNADSAEERHKCRMVLPDLLTDSRIVLGTNWNQPGQTFVWKGAV